MNENGIDNVMYVWESKNKIISPNPKEEILKIFEQFISPFAAGEFYYFVFNLFEYKFDYVSDGLTEVLGIPPEEYNLNKFFEILHPEDLDKLSKKEEFVLDFLLNQTSTEDILCYKAVYLMRLRNSNGEYKTILHQAKTINISKCGKIQNTVCIHADVTHLDIPVDHKVSLIGDGRPSYYSIETDKKIKRLKNNCRDILTEREKEILKFLSKGMLVNEIAEKLFVSSHTVSTHKRNILKKSNCKNITELVARCIREGVI